MDKPLLQKLLKDNPAGNGHEMTPFVLLREKKDEKRPGTLRFQGLFFLKVSVF